jgi:hypothetical protein
MTLLTQKIEFESLKSLGEVFIWGVFKMLRGSILSEDSSWQATRRFSYSTPDARRGRIACEHTHHELVCLLAIRSDHLFSPFPRGNSAADLIYLKLQVCFLLHFTLLHNKLVYSIGLLLILSQLLCEYLGAHKTGRVEQLAGYTPQLVPELRHRLGQVTVPGLHMLLVPHRCTLLSDLSPNSFCHDEKKRTPFAMRMRRWMEREMKGMWEG